MGVAIVGGLALPGVLSAEGTTARDAVVNTGNVIRVKPDSRLEFGDIECLARTTTYRYLVCLSSVGKYEVAVSSKTVVIVRARDGRILYTTP